MAMVIARTMPRSSGEVVAIRNGDGVGDTGAGYERHIDSEGGADAENVGAVAGDSDGDDRVRDAAIMVMLVIALTVMAEVAIAGNSQRQ